MSYIVVLMTTSSREEAEKIAYTLLEEKLIACANILDKVSSLFLWQGKIDKQNETLVIMKSHETLFKKLSQKITEIHSYEVPELLALPIVDASQAYANWLRDSLNR
ncbi:MAG: divalent-cation tolerance protein CutA [Candidatus Bathyarchaeia archaeon]|jgi:periplasmic divalent cation tolerance protein